MTAQPPTPFEPTRDEKLRMLEDERRVNTRAALTEVLTPRLSARFAKEAKADFTVGRDPVVHYPRLPQGGPWGAGPQLPDEPPFPEDINYVEACGTPEEIERAAAILSASVEHSAATALPPPQGQSAADPFPLGDQHSASLIVPPVGEADLSSSCGSSDPSTAVGNSAPTSPSVVATAPGVGAAFSNSAQPSIAEPSRESRTGREELSKAGSITRRFGK